MKSLFFLFLLFPLTFFAQDTSETSLVKWLNIEDAEELYKKTPKPMLIDVYTDWCGWCKYMMKTTYSNPSIAGFINANFYPVKLDAESADTISFGGKKYTKNGKTNQIAVEILNGQLSYPSTVFYSLNGQKFVVPGYLKTNQIEPFLVYFAENLLNNIGVREFNSAYMFTYPKNYTEDIKKLKANQKPDTSGNIIWTTFDEIKNLQNNNQNKKYLLFTNVNWCYNCKIMKKITFSNSAVSEIINENYYLIDFDAATEKTIEINGTQYKSLGKNQPNQLTMSLFKDKQLFLPSLVLLDNKFSIITVIEGYQTPKNLEPILQYFSTDKWKTEQYDVFLKSFKSKL